jgi:Txe/YoeB family toxin of Txe-Axe toxin-antitoxin module
MWFFIPKPLRNYTEWQTEDRKTLKKINDLIKDIQRNGLMRGLGKPELLKHLALLTFLWKQAKRYKMEI